MGGFIVNTICLNIKDLKYAIFKHFYTMSCKCAYHRQRHLATGGCLHVRTPPQELERWNFVYFCAFKSVAKVYNCLSITTGRTLRSLSKYSPEMWNVCSQCVLLQYCMFCRVISKSLSCNDMREDCAAYRLAGINKAIKRWCKWLRSAQTTTGL